MAVIDLFAVTPEDTTEDREAWFAYLDSNASRVTVEKDVWKIVIRICRYASNYAGWCSDALGPFRLNCTEHFHISRLMITTLTLAHLEPKTFSGQTQTL